MRKSILFFFCFIIVGTNVFCNDVAEHKKKFIDQLMQDFSKKNDPNYDIKRVLLTISCNDCDEIPKVEHAGEYIQNSEGLCQIMHNGIVVIKGCYYGEKSSWMDDIIYALKGHHEPQEEKVFYEVLKYIPSEAVMLELGSYWAYYSLWFAKQIPHAKNYLIEPSAERLKIGQRNFNLNSCSGNFYQAFVGIKGDSQVDFTNVPLIGIDDFLAREHIEHLNILHADIQGAELLMLKSCVKSIKSKKIDYFFISTHGDIHNQCLQFFKKHGLEILVEHSYFESVSCDGLIVAKRQDVAGPKDIQITKIKPKKQKMKFFRN